MDDDLSWAWPAWKFDMKRGDLFTKLHDQYNTYSSSLQDPAAFYHDIFEISQEASSTTEFHHLAATRKQQRLHELNYALESASFEIIGNPNLIGTTQWQYAVQLFREKSLDSLVRYFASYLPDDHLWHPLNNSSAPAPATHNPEFMPCLLDDGERDTKIYEPPSTANRVYSGRLASTCATITRSQSPSTSSVVGLSEHEQSFPL